MPAHANRRSTRDTVAGLQACCQEQDEWFEPYRTEDWQVISLNHRAEHLKLIREITWE
jgi:hypothetical protein